MRPSLLHLEQFRVKSGPVVKHYGWKGDDTCGAFLIPSCVDRATIGVIVSSGAGWDHVSVSRKNRTPNWREMCQIKDLFFLDDETVMQLHVPSTDHVNDHPNCLHLWRPIDGEIPRPPGYFVGGVTADLAAQRLREDIAAGRLPA